MKKPKLISVTSGMLTQQHDFIICFRALNSQIKSSAVQILTTKCANEFRITEILAYSITMEGRVELVREFYFVPIT